jgi:N-methylhydantoinase B
MKGDVLTLYPAGGGGYGPVAERRGEAIAADIAQGYVTEAAARAAYGRTG